MATTSGTTDVNPEPKSPHLNTESDSVDKNLIRKRGVIKAKLTTFKKYISSLGDQSLSELQRAELNLRMLRAKTLLTDFEDIQDSIMNSTHLNSDSEGESLENFESEYYTAVNSIVTVSRIFVKNELGI
jgi:hypothetical protein